MPPSGVIPEDFRKALGHFSKSIAFLRPHVMKRGGGGGGIRGPWPLPLPLPWLGVKPDLRGGKSRFMASFWKAQDMQQQYRLLSLQDDFASQAAGTRAASTTFHIKRGHKGDFLGHSAERSHPHFPAGRRVRVPHPPSPGCLQGPADPRAKSTSQTEL